MLGYCNEKIIRQRTANRFNSITGFLQKSIYTTDRVYSHNNTFVFSTNANVRIPNRLSSWRQKTTSAGPDDHHHLKRGPAHRQPSVLIQTVN